MERIYVSWTEQWDIARYVDHYLEARHYVVDAAARVGIRKLIAHFPGKAPIKKGDLDFYLDRNVPKKLHLQVAAKPRKKVSAK
jgi:hypothetical protein